MEKESHLNDGPQLLVGKCGCDYIAQRVGSFDFAQEGVCDICVRRHFIYPGDQNYAGFGSNDFYFFG
jgi:hypothetical protein